ncbi:hypothetical protein BDF14DRAFT_1840523 [Spinellus fusiger]|nr:hypothetical protein BDF14DRAFT_1840523 [Spinellus fusiger]
MADGEDSPEGTISSFAALLSFPSKSISSHSLSYTFIDLLFIKEPFLLLSLSLYCLYWLAMAVLSGLVIVSRRWRPPLLQVISHEHHRGLLGLVPKDLFDSRVVHLSQFVKSSCPSVHSEYYIYIFTVTCVLCSAAFSLAARSVGISMWYPLLLLLIPAGLNLWVNHHRSRLVDQIKDFEFNLKKTLKEFTKTDIAVHRIKWGARRLKDSDQIKPSHKVGLFCLLVEIISIEEGEEPENLPPYQTSISFENLRTMPNTLPPSYSEVALMPTAVCRPSSVVIPFNSSVNNRPPTLL